MVIAIVALAVVALAGPVIAYRFAVSKLRKRGGESGSRVRQLEDEIRRLRSAPAWPPQAARPTSGLPSVPAPPPIPGPIQAPPQQAPARAAPPVAVPGRRSNGGAERFANEPPLFGDDRPAAPIAPQRAEPPPPVQPPQPSSHPQPAPRPQSPPTLEVAGTPVESSAPVEPPVPAVGDIEITVPAETLESKPDSHGDGTTAAVQKESEQETTSSFRSVSDIIDEADARDLDWLGQLSTGRRIRLQRLGYDAPAKLANLRRSEIRRLARELDVAEKEIRDRWIPAASAQLKKANRP